MPLKYYPVLFLILAFFSTCRKDCRQGRSDTRPPLSGDALKWIEISNKTPKFKITTTDKYTGKVVKIDTVQGSYNLTKTKEYFTVDDCFDLQYDVYKFCISIPYDAVDYGNCIFIDNFPEKGYRGELWIGDFNENTKLDTALINGKIYHNVYKTSDVIPTRYFYAKEIGFIYIQNCKTSNGVTIIEHKIIELIP